MPGPRSLIPVPSDKARNLAAEARRLSKQTAFFFSALGGRGLALEITAPEGMILEPLRSDTLPGRQRPGLEDRSGGDRAD